MEKIRKYRLIRNIVGAALFSIAVTQHGVSEPQVIEVATADQSIDLDNYHMSEIDFEKLSISVQKPKLEWFNLIPPFFEGCEVLAQGWIGRGSVYTESGCIGCREDLLMANGERLFDNKPTFAAWKDDLNTFYALRNTENGLRAKGKLTDRGGFDRLANPKLVQDKELAERTFDLSLALSVRLGHIQTSKKTLVDFNKLDCG